MMEQPAFTPGALVEMTWYPPDGATFDVDAYTGVAGTETELTWNHEGYMARWPAYVTEVRVAGDGSYAAAKLQILGTHGEVAESPATEVAHRARGEARIADEGSADGARGEARIADELLCSQRPRRGPDIADVEPSGDARGEAEISDMGGPVRDTPCA
jgi:hypothetical protein